jgi:hypothetical protein
MAHVKKINVEKNYWTCGVLHSLSIKFFLSLNAIFLFLGSLTCALCAQINMTLKLNFGPNILLTFVDYFLLIFWDGESTTYK